LSSSCGPLLRAKFHPHRCNDMGIGPPKLKFLLKFDQNVDYLYKRPSGACPLRDFHKICRICTPFQHALAVKISLNFIKWLWSYVGFKIRGSGYSQIFSVPYRRNYAIDPQKFSKCKNVFEVLHHRAKFGWARISPAAGAAKNVEYFICLFVCLFVRHACECQSLCARFSHEGFGVQRRF